MIDLLLPFLLLSPAYAGGQNTAPACKTPQELRARFSAVAFDCRGCGVLLIDLDGLRADRLGYAGYKHDVSPFIDSLARRGIVFRNAMAQSSWTYPSAASVVTSQYPSAHGANLSAAVLNASLPTVFSVSRAKGYRVFGDDRRPFAWKKKMIMDMFENSFDNPDYRAELNAVIDGMAASPSLAYLINLDLHEPYVRGPSAAAGADPDTALYLEYSKEHQKEHKGEPFTQASADVVAAVNRLYDRRVRYVDERIKALFADLGGKGLLDRTVVVLYSNHGELIFEHSYWGHGYGYFDEEIHVPLIMLHPKINEHNSAVICPQVELIDLAPTLFEMLGFRVPGFGQGKSLLPLIRGRADERVFKYAFSDGARGESGREGKMARTREWKLTSAGDGSYRLFDLTQDPGETRDVKAENKNAFTELKVALGKWEKENRISHRPSIYDQSDAEKAALIKWGYW